MEQMMAMMRQMQGGGGAPQPDKPLPDTAEKIQISSLSLLKMLKHGRAGVPMEVMGLMLGQFVDDYTITCVDVFAMPQVREILCIYSHHHLNIHQ
jgi:26S proteasome regulatory subunit N11